MTVERHGGLMQRIIPRDGKGLASMLARDFGSDERFTWIDHGALLNWPWRWELSAWWLCLWHC